MLANSRVVTLRLTDEALAELRAAASVAGRSLAEEMRARLSRSWEDRMRAIIREELNLNA